jgi:hypothetical protein
MIRKGPSHLGVSRIRKSKILRIEPDFISFHEGNKLLSNSFHHRLSCKFMCCLRFVLSVK